MIGFCGPIGSGKDYEANKYIERERKKGEKRAKTTW
jgi:hypothetical protein